MPNLSLADVVEVVSRAGTPKASKVAEIKNRRPYDPAGDFYKPLRDRIVDAHKNGEEKKALTAFLDTLTDKKKITNYPSAIDGYKKWWGKKDIEWFEPKRAVYSHAGIDVAANPELGLIVDGEHFMIKLYLKADPLAKLRIDLVTVLMETALRPKSSEKEKFGLLDVRKSKLFTLAAPLKQTQAIVDAELAYIAALWPSL